MKHLILTSILVSLSRNSIATWPSTNSTWKLETRTCLSGKSLLTGPGELKILTKDDPNKFTLYYHYVNSNRPPFEFPLPCTFTFYYEMQTPVDQPQYMNYESGSMTSQSCMMAEDRFLTKEWRALSYKMEERDSDHVVVETWNPYLCSGEEGIVLNAFSRVN